jgi:hypothetical protein
MGAGRMLHVSVAKSYTSPLAKGAFCINPTHHIQLVFAHHRPGTAARSCQLCREEAPLLCGKVVHLHAAQRLPEITIVFFFFFLPVE